MFLAIPCFWNEMSKSSVLKYCFKDQQRKFTKRILQLYGAKFTKRILQLYGAKFTKRILQLYGAKFTS